MPLTSSRTARRAALAALALLALAAAWALERRTRPAPRAFSPAAWTEAGVRERLPLAADLVRSRGLDGLDRGAVVALLGFPDERGSQRWHYQLRGRWLFCELELDWDEDGAVRAARIDT